jgi:DNA-binding NarL/FixJ family response regulator
MRAGGRSRHVAESSAMKQSEMTQLTATPKIRVLVVDDHPLLRSGIWAVLESEEDVLLVGEAANGREAIASFRVHRPDVTLMDVQMPVMNGIDAIVAIRREFPTARFVVLTTYHGDALALRALKAGATGYLLKNMLREELVVTIRAIHAGRRHIPPEIAEDMAEHIGDEALSAREVEVLRRIAGGNRNRQIGERLFICEETVKVHIKHIMDKLGAKDRTEAITIAVRRGIIEL